MLQNTQENSTGIHFNWKKENMFPVAKDPQMQLGEVKAYV